MKVRILLLLLAAAIAQADTAESRLQHYLDNLKTFEAQFRQQVTSADGKVAEESSGRFYLQRPGQLRWDYQQPAEQTIVADGVNLWLYDKDLQQVTVKSLNDSLTATPALLLAGKGKVADTFDVVEGASIRLTPKRADTDFTAVELTFVDNELAGMQLKDKLGQTTRITFSAIKRNGSLSPSLFKFTPPPGADLIGKPAS